MYRRLLLSTLVSSLMLSACATLPAGNQMSTQLLNAQTPIKPVLGSALLKRALLLQRIDGQVVPVAGVVMPSQGFNLLQISAGIAPSATMIASPGVAVSRPAIAPMYYYGGGDFNQYTIQYAEESIHKAGTGTTLLQAYSQDVKPLLAEWDASARLIESRAQVNGSDDEYIYLPGKEGDPIKVQPLYVFRFASSPKKETLNIYILKNEIRVHRMVWGEPVIEIAKVKIDSDKAVEIARKAFANQDIKPTYPVYPDGLDPNARVIKDIPSDVKWNLQLNQQNKTQLRYFLNFSFEQKVAGPQPPTPDPMPVPMMLDQASSTGQAMTPSSSPVLKPGTTAMPVYYQQQFYGSIEIDAITGEIKSMNRPVWYGPVAYGQTDAVAGSSGGGSAQATTTVASPTLMK